MNLFDLLFPPRCIFCHRVLPRDVDSVCLDCQQSIALSDHQPHKVKGSFYKCVYRALSYEGNVRKCLHRYKFGGKSSYADPLSRILQQALPRDQVFDLITFVPTNPRNVKRRGFHHTKLLAQRLSAHTGIPCIRLLDKRRNTRPMYGLHPAQRRANILGAIAPAAPMEVIAGKRILVVDDLITTGSTLSECARVLLETGAAGVWGVTVAESKRFPKRRKEDIEKLPELGYNEICRVILHP